MDYRRVYNSADVFTAIFPLSNTTVAIGQWYQEGNYFGYARSMLVNGTTINFLDGALGGSTTRQNNYNIPVAIYGIK